MIRARVLCISLCALAIAASVCVDESPLPDPTRENGTPAGAASEGTGGDEPTFVAYDTFADDLRNAVTELALGFNARGDAKVHSFVTSQVQPGLGCGTHPSVEQHQVLGAELAADLKSTLGL